jgi:GDP-mannose 4,6 dehydratase
VAAIHCGILDCLYLGNLNAQRDWGHARDYVEGMWRIMQQSRPDDYVLATRKTHSLREFVELAFAKAGIAILWQGEGVEECGLCQKTNRTLVRVDPRYFRRTEVEVLLGDPATAKARLGWQHQISFHQLVREMVATDLKVVSRRLDGTTQSRSIVNSQFVSTNRASRACGADHGESHVTFRSVIFGSRPDYYGVLHSVNTGPFSVSNCSRQCADDGADPAIVKS